MLKKLICNIKAAWLWNKAIDMTSSGNYREAFETLTDVFRLKGRTHGHFKNRFDENILSGHLMVQMKNYNDAIRTFNIAKSQINTTSILNDIEKKYLRYYCNWDILHSKKAMLEEITCADMEEIKSFDFSSIENVRLNLRQKFPVCQLSEQNLQ